MASDHNSNAPKKPKIITNNVKKEECGKISHCERWMKGQENHKEEKKYHKRIWLKVGIWKDEKYLSANESLRKEERGDLSTFVLYSTRDYCHIVLSQFGLSKSDI